MLLFAILFLLLTSCSHEEAPTISGEKIWRLENEKSLQFTLQKAKVAPYPWSRLDKITKEYFRCKGSSLNPPHIISELGKEKERFYDCAGAEKHSLPIRDGKEYIYPILITLLNEVQQKTGKAVVITSGHRCPTHNTYVDARPKSQSSKHLIGAQVDFYVQGMQDKPQEIVKILCDYYKNSTKEYQTFTRYEKECDVSTPPWCNKEVFIKLYTSLEGRNFDNRHSFPYISIQVRFDPEKNDRVLYTPQLAQQYLRK